MGSRTALTAVLAPYFRELAVRPEVPPLPVPMFSPAVFFFHFRTGFGFPFVAQCLSRQDGGSNLCGSPSPFLLREGCSNLVVPLHHSF